MKQTITVLALAQDAARLTRHCRVDLDVVIRWVGQHEVHGVGGQATGGEVAEITDLEAAHGWRDRPEGRRPTGFGPLCCLAMEFAVVPLARDGVGIGREIEEALAARHARPR